MPDAFISFALNRVLKLSIIAVLLFSIVPIPSLALTTSDHNSTVLPLIQKKNAHSQSLDSLDLLKQRKKREGSSFSEIELKQKQILDSLQLIRKIIQTDVTALSQLSNNKNQFPLFSHPNLSDWVISVVAVTLLFTGILLLFRTVKNVLFRSSKNFISNKPANLDTSLSNHPDNLLSGEFLDLSDIAKSQEKNEEQIHFDAKEKDPDHLDKKNDKDLEVNILKAASEGMSVQELSRHFHLSSDHITLVLKLAESRKK